MCWKTFWCSMSTAMRELMGVLLAADDRTASIDSTVSRCIDYLSCLVISSCCLAVFALCIKTMLSVLTTMTDCTVSCLPFLI